MAYGSVNVPGVSGVSEDELNKVKAAAETAKEDAANALNAAGLAAKTADEAKVAAGEAQTAAAEAATALEKIQKEIEEGGGIGGGDSANANVLTITFEAGFAGAEYTITDGSDTKSGTVPEGLTVSVRAVNCNSTYTITATADDGNVYVVMGAYYGQYSVRLAKFTATINVTAVTGAEITAVDEDGGTYRATADSSGAAAIAVNQAGRYTVSGTYEGATSNSATVTVSSNGGTYTAAVRFIVLTVNAPVGSQLTVQNGSVSLSGTSNGRDAYYLPSTGSWTVTMVREEKTVSRTVNVVAYTDYAIKVMLVSAILEENDWETIREVSDAGEGENYWDVGDLKSITLNGKVGKTTLTNLKISAFIIGFNHNSEKEGENRIHFQIGKISGKPAALCDSSYNSRVSADGYFSMNTSETNDGGWRNSYMRNTLLGGLYDPKKPLENSLLAAMPEDLRQEMKSVTKYTDNVGNGTNATGNVTGTTDYLWLLSEYEVQGKRTYANNAEQSSQKQYDYYKAGNSKIAYKHSATNTAVWWWLRSPYYYYNYGFCFVYTDGTANNNNANYSAGVLPGFCYTLGQME